MGIKVNLENGNQVEVGGEFGKALEMVKSIEGRCYDSATKTWTVPMSLRDFCEQVRFWGLPVDVLVGEGHRYMSGNHVTRYGNAYSAEEWQAQKDVWAAEREVTREFSDAIEAPKQWLVEEMVAIGIPERAAKSVLALAHDFEYQVEVGKIQFSSQEREEKVRSLIAEYWKRQMAACEAEEAALDSVRTKIWEGAGIL